MAKIYQNQSGDWSIFQQTATIFKASYFIKNEMRCFHLFSTADDSKFNNQLQIDIIEAARKPPSKQSLF